MKLEKTLLQPGGLVLAVDDQPENLDLVEEILSSAGYRVNLAADGEAALQSVAADPPDVIILDIMMPRLDGFEVCRRIKAGRDTRFIPVVMLTALTQVSDKVRGLEVGADDFLNKPVHQEELLARVRSLLRIKRLRDELDTSENIIVSMTQAMEHKDPLSTGHSERVTVSAIRLAQRLGLGTADIEVVGKGAILHDLGKLGVPEHILWASHALSPEETQLYRQHPRLGEQILAPLLSFSAVREVVRHHHERLDGSGYPDGVSGQDFTLAAEIVAIANAYENGAAHDDPAQVAMELRAAGARGEFHREMVEEYLNHAALPHGGAPLPAWTELLALPEPARTGKVLVGDDTRANREVLEEILHAAGHQVVCVDNGASVLRAVKELLPDLVLVDIRMPGMDGFEVCRRIKSQPETEFLPVILVTAHPERTDRSFGAQAGADDFLSVPINREELIARVKSLLRLRLFFRDLEEHQSVILSLASALEAKDPYTRGHSERVGTLAARLARELGMNDAECEVMKVAGQLHDIGKIGVPERLLNKPGALTESEFQTIMTHPARGELICKPLRTVQSTLPLIRFHHERFDGRGYPDHLKGDSIPYGARVLAMADAFDALTSERSYRKTLTAEDALSILARETENGLWDPKIFHAMSLMIRRNAGGSSLG
jgi:putative two-component system response regulator